MENGPGAEGRDPSGFLSEIIGAPVIVKLNSGVVYKGRFIFTSVQLIHDLMTQDARRAPIGRWIHEYCS